jgi:hypothetical protein
VPQLRMGGRSSPSGPKAAAEPPHSKARFARNTRYAGNVQTLPPAYAGWLDCDV